jgi:general stress protein 26
MTTPVTTLDQRFSNPDAVATDWAETREVLEQAQLFWVVTVRANGRPHVTPLVAVWAEGAVHFCTGAEEQKAVNLQGNPHVVVMTGRLGHRPGRGR